MAFLAPIAAPLMVAGTLVSAMGGINAGSSQQSAAQYNAKIAEQAAGEAEAAGTVRTAQEYRKNQLALQSNTAQAAASGVNPGFGSPVTNAGRLAKYGTLNELMAGYDAKVQGVDLRNQASADKWMGDQAKAASYWNAGSSIISGASTLAAKYG